MTKSYVIKPAAPFERLKSFNAFPDIALRRAIIMQAVIDSTNTSLRKEAKKAEYNSKNWIFEDNENFTNICLEVGVEPSWVKAITKELITLQHNKLPLKVKPTKKLISKAVKKKFIL